MSSTILSIDVGTSSLKAVVIDSSGNMLGTARNGYDTRIPRGGWAEQSPGDWLSALQTALRDLAQKLDLEDVSALVFTGQMSAGLLVDRDAEPLTPCLIWSDHRAGTEAAATAKAFGADALHRLTGNPPSPTYTGPKLAWFNENMPQDRAAAFLQPKDWMIAQLTGRFVTDPSDASCTGLFDLKSGEWSRDLFDVYGIAYELAPEVLASTALAGELSDGPARALGLKAGLPVVVGGGDGPVAGAGAGTLAGGDASASLGTSAWVSFATDAPACDPGSGLSTYAHVVPGLALETGSMQSAGASLEWAAKLFDTDPASFARRALAVIPNPDAPIFLPYLQGERTPHWINHAAGSFLGLGRRHDAGDMSRAILEGVLFQLRTILQVFEARGQVVDELTYSGDFGSGDGFAVLMANTLSRPVRALAGAEHTTALGAAMIAFLGLGAIASFEDARPWIRKADVVYPKYESNLVVLRHKIFSDAWKGLVAPSAHLAALADTFGERS